MAAEGEHTNCEEVLDELYTFLDGELTEAKRTTIRNHLDDCSPCLETIDFYAELRLVVSQRCRDQVPDTLRQRVLDAIRQAATGN